MKILFLSILYLAASSFAVDSTQVADLKAKAEAGKIEAQYQLGLKHLKRYNYVTDNYTEIAKENFEAEKWLHRAAEHGHVLAQYKLGILYHPDYEGLYGFTEEVWRAREEARKKVHPDSLEFARGDYGIPYEINAEKWLIQAAGAGLAEAQFSLGELYLFGYGSKGNFIDGISWLERAAWNDYTYAQYELGQHYVTPGPIMNMPRAYLWSKIARDKNYEPAIELLRNIENKLSEKELQEAQKLLDEWYKRKEK